MACLTPSLPVTCERAGASRSSYAAASAVASSGSLIDLGSFTVVCDGPDAHCVHEGQQGLSVLSTTLPIMRTFRSYPYCVYMTSRGFAYAEYCMDAMFAMRATQRTRYTLVVCHASGDRFEVTDSDGKVASLSATAVIERVTVLLAYPMSCAICDWEGVPCYANMATSVDAAVWWYPCTTSLPLVSRRGADYTAYYARAYGTASGHCVMVGSFGALKRADSMLATWLSRQWGSYNMLLQRHMCARDKCFSCVYVEACMRMTGTSHITEVEIHGQLLLDL